MAWKTRAAGIALVVASGVLTGVEPASASGGEHCVVDVTTGSERCYGSFREAVSAATGGRVTDVPDGPGAAAADRSFEDRINEAGRQAAATPARQADVVLSIEYDWNYYQDDAGSMFYSAATQCKDNGGADWELRSLGDDWNDRISSFAGYNNCEVDHYEHDGFGGASTGWLVASESMMDQTHLNNLTSSIRWG